MQPRDRIAYSAIIDRPPLPMPDGKRMAVWTIVNVEDWAIERPMPRAVLSPPMGQPLQPDVPNWSWHEYGMRVGFWRLLEVLQRYEVGVTLAINGLVCQTYPRVAEAALKAGWEFMGHGFEQLPMHRVEDQPAAIVRTIDAIRAFTGKAPRGWESPGLTETDDTADHLTAAGIEYVADWVLDDQPVELATKNGPLVSIPYTVEINDIPMMALQHHGSEEMLQRGRDQFDQLYRESRAITRVMSISTHPYITGAPHRIGYLEKLLQHIRSHDDVAMWSGEQVVDWYKSVNPCR
jgi:allantoinase